MVIRRPIERIEALGAILALAFCLAFKRGKWSAFTFALLALAFGIAWTLGHSVSELSTYVAVSVELAGPFSFALEAQQHF